MSGLVLATTNPGKLRELRHLLAHLPVEVFAPADLGIVLDVVEDGDSFAANAARKARAYATGAALPALGDDSGLEVDALGGFPGVVSSRWVDGGDAERVRALLERLRDVPTDRRTARFRCAAALAWPDGRLVTAAGQVEGRIATAPRGTGGFGYDPVFLVEDGGYDGRLTVAELPAEEKDRLSHRGRAVRALLPLIEGWL